MNNKAQNYWPGFVDALSNLILVLVFVIIVFAISVFAGILTISRLQEQDNLKLQSTIESLKKDNSSVRYDLNEVVKQNKIYNPVYIIDLYPNITISYAFGVTLIPKNILIDFDNILDKKNEKLKSLHVTIKAEFGEPSLSEGQRLSYYRILFLRNYLISRGVIPKNIKSEISSIPSYKKRSEILMFFK